MDMILLRSGNPAFADLSLSRPAPSILYLQEPAIDAKADDTEGLQLYNPESWGAAYKHRPLPPAQTVWIPLITLHRLPTGRAAETGHGEGRGLQGEEKRLSGA